MRKSALLSFLFNFIVVCFVVAAFYGAASGLEALIDKHEAKAVEQQAITTTHTETESAEEKETLTSAEISRILQGISESKPLVRTEQMVQAETETAEDPEQTARFYTDAEIIMLAKVLYLECRGLSDTEKACVAWVICNRVDNTGEFYAQNTISAVITAPYQFAYSYDTPVWDSLYELASDVLERWNAERNGETDVGRVLPSEYLFFYGDGQHNYFRTTYQGGTQWDYSLDSPYDIKN